jgi:prephenate dehydrogenase
MGAIDSIHLQDVACCASSDLIVLATPVGAFESYLRQIAPTLKEDAWITDVGSTKAEVAAAAERILGAPAGRGGFVGSHPMAGSERKGASFARADLFEQATCILTPGRETPEALTCRGEDFWQGLGMRTCRMAPEEHDRALARVSHLPHVVAALLMGLPADGDLRVAATGFRDTTRLASGDPEMWRDILLSNREAILEGLDELSEATRSLRGALASGDAGAIEAFFAAAKTRRDETVGRQLTDPSSHAI